MKAALRIAGGCIAVLLMLYFIWFCIEHLDLQLLADTLSQPHIAFATVLASLCYMAIYPLTGWAWKHLLLGQQEKRTTLELTVWLGITQLAKYIPGNVAQHAGRAYIAISNGMPARTFLITTSQEILLSLSASTLVGATALAFSGAQLPDPTLRWALGVLVAGSVLGTVLFCLPAPDSSRLPAAIRRVLQLIGGLPGWRLTLRCLATYSLNYLLVGLGIWLIALALGIGNHINYGLAVAAFALSWALGFLAPGAPAGLGAREGIMLLLLHNQAHASTIVILTLLARVVSMSGDFTAFAASQFLKRRCLGQGPTAEQRF